MDSRIVDRITIAETEYTKSRKWVNAFLAAVTDCLRSEVSCKNKGLLKSLSMYCLYKVFAATSPTIRISPYRGGNGNGLSVFLLI